MVYSLICCSFHKCFYLWGKLSDMTSAYIQGSIFFFCYYHYSLNLFVIKRRIVSEILFLFDGHKRAARGSKIISNPKPPVNSNRNADDMVLPQGPSAPVRRQRLPGPPLTRTNELKTKQPRCFEASCNQAGATLCCCFWCSWPWDPRPRVRGSDTTEVHYWGLTHTGQSKIIHNSQQTKHCSHMVLWGASKEYTFGYICVCFCASVTSPSNSCRHWWNSGEQLDK